MSVAYLAPEKVRDAYPTWLISFIEERIVHCKGCGNEAVLVKAHIIPESFFVAYDRSVGVSRLMTDINGVYPKRVPIGVYDENILCRACEDTFQEYDDYAAKVLLNEKSAFNELKHNGSIVGWQRTNVDYKKLKIFFLSLLWRASVSGHVFFSKVRLGPFQNVVKDMIWEGQPGSNDTFSCVLSRFDVDLGGFALDPHRERWDNRNWMRIYFGEYMLLIRCDQRSGPEKFERLRFENDGILTIIARDFLGSAEVNLMSKIVLKNERR
jgi:hypothetical protein